MNKTKKRGNVYPFYPKNQANLGRCLFCGTNDNLIVFRDHNVCAACVKNIRELYVNGCFFTQVSP